jgi:hypothetical protein
MLARGMNLVLDPLSEIQSLEAAHPNSRARYIDNILSLIYANIAGLEPMSSSSSCSQTASCVITAADIANIHAAFSVELNRIAADPRIVGFYILDDRIGDTRKLEQDIHTWIAQAGLHKPTICGFQGRLDVPSSVDWMGKIQYYAAEITGYGKAGEGGVISNYSPAGCDAVALYPFSPRANTAHDAAAFGAATDWKMNKPVWACGSTRCTLLNFYKFALAKHGWTAATPLIGVPQAFGHFRGNTGVGFYWQPPTAAQLTDETAAFCGGGALSVVAWAWHVVFPGSISPFQSRSLRAGLAHGVRACRAVWNRQPTG